MQPKEAVAAAKSYVHELYGETENIADISLEEVEYDDAKEQWLVTVEFSRPANNTLRTRMREMVEAYGGEAVPRRRVQKVVVVSDKGGTGVALRNRETA